LIAGVSNGRLYTSSDSGANWTERKPAGDANKYWYSVASDDDGSNLIVGAWNGRLYTSSNSGVNWTERQPASAVNKLWKAVASDADGSNLIAGIQSGRLYTSSNSGVNWTERQPAGAADKNWISVASDSDGSSLIVSVAAGRLYTSSDSGVGWTEQQPTGAVDASFLVASNNDGSRLVVAYFGLYTGSILANNAPSLTSISDSPDPIKTGEQITITPAGQGDTESSDLYFYCNESGSPTSANTLCSEANTSYSSPYSSMTCTYNVSGNTTKGVYCRTSDGTDFSTEVATTYVVDSTEPSGGEISYTNGYYTSLSILATYSTGSDSGSGLNNSTGKIQRSYAELSNESCGDFSSFADLHTGYDDSPYSDTDVESGKCYKYQYIISDNVANTATYTSENVAKVDAVNPTTSDDFANNDTWKNSNQTITLTPTDLGGSGISWTKYCQDTDNSCDPSTGTDYTDPVEISTEGTSYFRYASQDNAGNTQATVSKTVKIDTTEPTLSEVTAIESGTDTTPDYTFNSTEAGTISYGGSCSSDTTSANSGDNTITLSGLGVGSYDDCTIIVTDSLGNISSTLAISSFTIELKSTGGGGNSLPLLESIQTINDKNSQTILGTVDGAILEAKKQINNIVERISKLTDILNFNKNLDQQIKISYPPIEESVTAETPDAFKGLSIMDVFPTKNLGILPMSSNLSFFSKKVPQMKSALEDLGINDLNSAEKLNGVELTIPGLTSLALQNTGLSMAKWQPIPSIPLAKLSSKEKKQIPTDIVFARSEEGLIDYNIGLSFGSQGDAQQRISTIVGKTIELVVKPDSPAKKVSGYVILRNKETAKAENLFYLFKKYFSAALTGSFSESIEQPISGLLLQKFEYSLVDQGIFMATITAPVVEGEYDITTVIEYEDENLFSKQTSLVAVVDPEGYVYTNIAGMEARIKNAVVTIYWLNPDTFEYQIWDAEKYIQKNPHITDDTGKYSFLVPEGTYYLTVMADGYYEYQGEPFPVVKENGVHKNIELKKKFAWKDLIDWKIILIVLFIFALACFIYQNVILKKIIIENK
jgi:hypothetical protein